MKEAIEDKLDEETQAELDKITDKELNCLTPYDIAFLKARRSYLTKEQIEYFKSVLEDKKPKTK